jgi:hypothetical protein
MTEHESITLKLKKETDEKKILELLKRVNEINREKKSLESNRNKKKWE